MERKFFKMNLEAAEANGDETQQVDMAGLVAVNAHMAGELGDIIGGRRVQKDHPHHKPRDLTEAVIDGIVAIIQLRKEIKVKK